MEHDRAEVVPPEEVCARQRTERASHRRRFLRVAGHDLRGPLANVRSYAAFLAQEPELQPRTRRFLETICRNADRSLQLLSEVFASLSAEAGQLELEPARQPIGPLVQRVVAASAAPRGEKRVALGTELPRDLGEAEVDADAFVHALGAVLEHAIARTPAGGRVELSAAATPTGTRVRVVDGGPPLTVSERADLFDRERQIAAEGHLGPGFRLSLARAELEAMGAWISVEPPGPEGTPLTVVLTP